MIFSFALVADVAYSATKITPGTTCKVFKSKVVYLNKTYTCIKSGKKLVWSKGVIVKKPTPTPKPTPTITYSQKPKPSPMPSHTTLIFPPKTSVSAITNAPKDMTGINDQHSYFSGGMDPAFVTLGPKTGSKPELGSYNGKTGVNFEIALGKPILAPVDARFIGFNNRNSDFRNGMDGTLQVPFDDLQLCFESTSADWPGLIFCFYHLRNSPLLLGINKSPLCSNAKEWPGALRAEGWQFFTENDYSIPASAVSESCQALLGRAVKRGDVVAYSGTVGDHSQAPIMMKVPDQSINPTVKSGDKNLHWVQGDVFFYWKCYAKDAHFEPGVLAYPWECDGYSVPAAEQSINFKYSK
ncbi:MAG TPA: hypothetical protein VGJ85_06450 [Candidatus Nanopelagicaceae bacterium]|jgi:hypothetical protein